MPDGSGPSGPPPSLSSRMGRRWLPPRLLALRSPPRLRVSRLPRRFRVPLPAGTDRRTQGVGDKASWDDVARMAACDDRRRLTGGAVHAAVSKRRERTFLRDLPRARGLLQQLLTPIAYYKYVICMPATGLLHVLVTPSVEASQRFHEQHLDFAMVFDAGWYAQLQHPAVAAPQLALQVAGHPSAPPRDQVAREAIIVTIEVQDADATFRAVTTAGVEASHVPRDEAWGQRHFFGRDPGGHLVHVVQPNSSAGAYAAAAS